MPEIIGTQGADSLFGTAGNDQFQGLGGDDVITTNQGVDSVDGGAGRDRLILDYSGSSPGGYADGFIRMSSAGMDGGLARFVGFNAPSTTFQNMEELEYRAADIRLILDLYLIGDPTGQIANVQGGLANNKLRVDGSGLTVPLISTGSATAVGAGFTTNFGTFSNFSEIGILGGGAADQLTGSPLGEDLIGNGGDDVLLGLGGRDYLEGGAGADTLRGGDGADTLAPGAGLDIIEGGDGDDTIIVTVLDAGEILDGGLGHRRPPV
jgi:Ca2+-binding RTX toxin-like protein